MEKYLKNLICSDLEAVSKIDGFRALRFEQSRSFRVLTILRVHAVDGDSEHTARSNCRVHRFQICFGIADGVLAGPLTNRTSDIANHLAPTLDAEANHTARAEVSAWVYFGSISSELLLHTQGCAILCGSRRSTTSNLFSIRRRSRIILLETDSSEKICADHF